MNEKAAVGERAAEEYIKDGMIVGLGTGSTVYYTIVKIADMIKNGLTISGVATSVQTENLAESLGIPLLDLNLVKKIDVAIDGADEIDSDFCAIKGGGGALLREKLIAKHAEKFIVVVDSHKVVQQLGSFPLPVEVVPFGAKLTEKAIQKFGCKTVFREKEGKIFVTDNGNYIIDCYFSAIVQPKELAAALNYIPGIVENGLFINMVDHVITVGNDNKVIVL
ncbi:ribose-5-phosphate isomerase RpiA [Niallia sp. NCCP-28]|uniref:ribose-5-phosphate isomerase RpiA n=1 Tax=Niallia sp. NCCP-28 TaxID=2934712 RepID=UPI002089C0FD|nr:ribose-5-phosphate isomerase RpiA [Niallia sp. NCCP-28]GKU83354.1 ribose-5-phosphate isomerase A [Niallia sp. NCCP-28]